MRLLIDRSGGIRLENRGLCFQPASEPADEPVFRVGLAAAPVDSSDIFLFHKTTHRAVYDQARQARPELDDTILWNARGEITESTIANVVVELEPGSRWTPPVECGLLAGTFREELLTRGEIAERVITKEELILAKRVWLINSVRRWRRVEIIEPTV